jgi:hypothetical protein
MTLGHHQTDNLALSYSLDASAGCGEVSPAGRVPFARRSRPRESGFGRVDADPSNSKAWHLHDIENSCQSVPSRPAPFVAGRAGSASAVLGVLTCPPRHLTASRIGRELGRSLDVSDKKMIWCVARLVSLDSEVEFHRRANALPFPLALYRTNRVDERGSCLPRPFSLPPASRASLVVEQRARVWTPFPWRRSISAAVTALSSVGDMIGTGEFWHAGSSVVSNAAPGVKVPRAI